MVIRGDKQDTDRLPYMPWYVDDWLSSDTITGFSVEQEGAYARLLMRAWKQPGCSLPNDDAILARFSRLGSRWRKVGRPIIDACFVRENGRLVNLKQREIWREVQEKSAKAKAAAEARWEKERQGRLLDGDGEDS
jgi:uncharacterized protein YdaU (DUF1376 family)